jgi:ELWxxDGT repeat protein
MLLKIRSYMGALLLFSIALGMIACGSGGGGGDSGAGNTNTTTTTILPMLYFSATDGIHGIEPWKTDGTEAGTVMVKDIFAGAAGSDPFQGGSTIPRLPIVFNNSLFFSANSDVAGYELWKTDGTEAGTVMVKDIYPSFNSPHPGNFIVYNDMLHFTGAAGVGIWRTDGTETNTVKVADLFWGWANPIVFGDAVIFISSVGALGSEPWKMTGSSLSLVKDINQIPGEDSSPSGFTIYNGAVYFSATDGANGNSISGNELWKTDGTGGGTVLVKDIYAGAFNSSSPAGFTVFNGNIFFAATDGNGRELWKSDGTNSGTLMIKDIVAGPVGANPSNLIIFGGELYFTTVVSGYGYQLWKTDGTEAGTVMVEDISPGTLGIAPGNFSVFNGGLYFTAANSDGYEIWISDGTETGTRMLKDINSGPGNSFPSDLRVFNDALYFFADDGFKGLELWKTDGTENGTLLVKDIFPGPSGSNAVGFVEF